MTRLIVFIALLATALVSPSPAQVGVAVRLARDLRSDVAVLSSEPDVATWQKAHAGNRLELAHYRTEKDPYETDFRRLNRWCAASVSRRPAEVVRTALFFVPDVSQGALPPLPEKEDKSLTQTCRMQALWYETSATATNAGDAALIDAIVRELSAAWGKPNGSFDTSLKRGGDRMPRAIVPTTASGSSATPDIRGGGLWKEVVAWHRAGINIWLAYDPKAWATSAPDDAQGRIIAFARRDSPPDSGINIWLLGGRLERRVIAEAARIADLDPPLAAAMMQRSFCMMDPEAETPTRYPIPTLEPESVTVGRVLQWLSKAKSLPPERQAAAFLVVDAYLVCAGGPTPRLIRAIGATAAGAREQQYSHYFRNQAEKLDPQGPAGELAGLSALADPCYLKGKGPWPVLEIKKGESLLQQFPADEWTPWIHFAVARSHAAKLSFSYAEGNPDEGVLALTPAEKQKERELAIEHFRKFLDELPDDPKSAFAWQEAWRLLSGLPPSHIGFGCSGD
ncbi:MAG: hypothetical protein WBW33_30800 [Bryobacteraceae bacterium]